MMKTSRCHRLLNLSLCIATACGATFGQLFAQDTAEVDLRTLRARAIRQAVATVADSVLRVELVGVAQSAGSEVADDAPTVAVAVDDQRHFIASSMVVRGNPTSILLVTPDGRRGVAEVVARDHSRQLVLLRANDDLGVPPLELSETQPIVGQTVVAVGRHSGGDSPAVSTGVLSATERNWGLALQTDARVSSGFYGGPLIDLHGRVLGIIVPMVPDGGAQDETGWYDSGIAFAIPAAALSERLPKLIEGTDINAGLVGIVARESDPYVESTEVAAVRPRSPAARAMLQAGDKITAIDAVEVRSHREIKQLLGSLDAGTMVNLTIERGDEKIEASLQLTDSIPPLVPQQIGVTAESAAVDGEANPQADESIVVTGVLSGSPADGKLEIGDVVASIDGVALDDVASLRRRVFAADPDEPLVLSVRRGGESLDIELQSEAIGIVAPDALPQSLRYTAQESPKWEVSDFDMPDLSNSAAIIGPPGDQAEGNAERAAAAGTTQRDAASRLGVMILLADPGEADLKKALEKWVQPAQAAGVLICIIGPAKDDRWTPEEVDVPQRFAAAIRQSYQVEATMQALAGSDKGPGASLAMAAAILRPGTFKGLQVSPEVRPPAVRLRENDPASPLQLWVPPHSEGGDAPSWTASLEKVGYAVLRGSSEPAAILSWVRSLARI
jgi:S1-C subfamily serine protease